MNISIIESMLEVSRIQAEIDSELIYESILIESDNKKSPIEKIKEIWKAFVNAMKRVIDNIKVFVRSNIRNIKYGSKEVEINDRSEEIKETKMMISDVSSHMDKLDSLNTVEYEKKVDRTNYKNNKKTMKKSDGVGFYENQLKDSQQLLNEADKVIDTIVKKYEGTNNGFKKDVKIQAVSTVMQLIKSNINKLINEISKDLKTLLA